MVEADVSEPDQVARHLGRLALSTRWPLDPPDLEQVREIGIQAKGQHTVLRVQGVVVDPDALLEGIGDDPVADDAQRLTGQDRGCVALVDGVPDQVRVGHLDGAPPAGAAAGPENHRAVVIETQLVAREHPCIAQVQAQSPLVATNIAVRVAEQEAAVVLEDERAGEVRRALDVRPGVTDGLVRQPGHVLPSSSRLASSRA